MSMEIGWTYQSVDIIILLEVCDFNSYFQVNCQAIARITNSFNTNIKYYIPGLF